MLARPVLRSAEMGRGSGSGGHGGGGAPTGEYSKVKTFGNIFISFVGAGVLGLPYAFSMVGTAAPAAPPALPPPPYPPCPPSHGATSPVDARPVCRSHATGDILLLLDGLAYHTKRFCRYFILTLAPPSFLHAYAAADPLQAGVIEGSVIMIMAGYFSVKVRPPRSHPHP